MNLMVGGSYGFPFRRPFCLTFSEHICLFLIRSAFRLVLFSYIHVDCWFDFTLFFRLYNSGFAADVWKVNLVSSGTSRPEVTQQVPMDVQSAQAISVARVVQCRHVVFELLLDWSNHEVRTLHACLFEFWVV